MARNTLLARTGTPITPVQFPSSCSHILLQNHGLCCLDIISAQFAHEHPPCSRTAVSRALGLAEFKLIYWGPAREGYKVTTTNAVQTHSVDYSIVHGTNLKLAILEDYRNRQTMLQQVKEQGCVRLLCLGFFISRQSLGNFAPRCDGSSTMHCKRYPSYLFRRIQILSSFCSYDCAKFINC